jgi:TonB family protein
MQHAIAHAGAELEAASRRQFRRLLGISLGVHAAVLVLFAWSPAFMAPPPGIPGLVTVDLVAAPPGGALEPTPAPPPPKPAPLPKPEVAPPPPVAKPVVPKPDKVVIPKEAVKPPEKAAQKPKAKPTPKPEAPPKSYDDLMDQLRAEHGEAKPQEVARAPAPPSTVPGPGSGVFGTVKVTPEFLAWQRKVQIHVRRNWILLDTSEPRVTTLRVKLDEAGNVIGEPLVVERSGDPHYDDSAIRAILKASPLPPPPRAGEWPIQFPSEEMT